MHLNHVLSFMFCHLFVCALMAFGLLHGPHHQTFSMALTRQVLPTFFFEEAARWLPDYQTPGEVANEDLFRDRKSIRSTGYLVNCCSCCFSCVLFAFMVVHV